MAKHGGGGQQRFQKPDGEVRQSQMVTGYGPGALVDLVDDAVIVGGLDFWHFADGYRTLDEPRLGEDLVARFKKLGASAPFLDAAHPFRAAPAGDSREPTQRNGVDVLEFPRWFVCQNPKCRALRTAQDQNRKKNRYWHDCDDGSSHECVPVRFVAACKNGHIDEFPWMAWVHAKVDGGACTKERSALQLLEGASGDFAEIRVQCVCGAHRALIEAAVDKANPCCSGRRPWLGSEGDEKCDEPVRLLSRAASHAYFAQIESALWVPEPKFSLREVVQRHWGILKNLKSAAKIATYREDLDELKELGDAKDDDVLAVIDAIRNGVPAAREPTRTAEYRQLVDAAAEPPGDLPKIGARFHAVRITVPGLTDVPSSVSGIRSIVLVKKLRQVRVQIGFTRLEPPVANLQGEFDLAVRTQRLGLQTDWLPATEVLGEGIFVELDEARVHAWETGAPVQQRAEGLQAGFEAWREPRGIEMNFPGPRYYLLHSLAHMLITALSIECGYPASSVAERIYCASHDDAVLPMAGILLLTGSPSAEGSLGGLVEEGRHLHEHLRRALDLGRLCSNDPVCAQHSPSADLSERHLEGAACHGCLYVAECSCERFNSFLDRALVVPTLGPDDCAYFAPATTTKNPKAGAG